MSEGTEYMVLSVKQPWANLIASGKKTIETRTWETRYRGPLLVVSSRCPNIAPAGCAVALVRLADCRPLRPKDEAAACSDWYPLAWAWCLTAIRRLKPFPVRRRLGIYRVTLAQPLEFLEEDGP